MSTTQYCHTSWQNPPQPNDGVEHPELGVGTFLKVLNDSGFGLVRFVTCWGQEEKPVFIHELKSVAPFPPIATKDISPKLPSPGLLKHPDARVETIEGQVEFVFIRSCTICGVTVKLCHCQSETESEEHLVYNHGIGLNKQLLDRLKANAADLALAKVLAKVVTPAVTSAAVVPAASAPEAPETGTYEDPYPKFPPELKALDRRCVYKLV
jgi:hypothetical protein